MRLIVLAVAGGGVGLGLLLARPNLSAVWGRLSELTHGGLSKALAAPPEDGADSPEREAQIRLADPAVSTLAQVASVGAVDAARPSLPDVVLSSPDVARRIGLKVEPVAARAFAPSVTGNAELTYNGDLYGEVRARVRGIVREVFADEGGHYHTGQPMLVIDSAEVGTTKSDYLAALPVEKLAKQTLDMTLALRKDNAAPLKDEMIARKDLNTATATVQNARQRLHNLGFTAEDLKKIEDDRDTSTLLAIRAPLDGTVVDRHCVVGEAVEPTDRLYVIANIRLMWAWIDVYETDIQSVEIGQPVYLSIAGVEREQFHGKVDLIDQALNPTTRTIRVRAEMDNHSGDLRANEFGRARIQVGPERQALFVPKDAVQTLGDSKIVFRPVSADRFAPVRVTVAEGDTPHEWQVLSGLRPGQSVVSTGAFLLKSELKKGEIAGEE
jgi:cobalt-zinc-cadmium efflux system membrane fusion protein